MLNKTWTFALALALAAAPVSSLLAAPGGGGGAAGERVEEVLLEQVQVGAGWRGAGLPNGENAIAGTAVANAIHRRRI